MRTSMAGSLRIAVLIASVAWTWSAWADVLPSPERPRDWDEHPAPMPAPPPEKDVLAYLIIGVILLSLSAGAEALRRRRASLVMRVGQRR